MLFNSQKKNTSFSFLLHLWGFTARCSICLSCKTLRVEGLRKDCDTLKPRAVDILSLIYRLFICRVPYTLYRREITLIIYGKEHLTLKVFMLPAKN